MTTKPNTKWQDLPLGGIIVHAGNASGYETGGWRAFRPKIERQIPDVKVGCTNCLLCWLYCPEGAIIVDDGVVNGVDLRFCKGCAICEEICPVMCISMVEEGSCLEDGGL
jgi:pyruvate ferredoxin oxidoreductase delta subunit